MSCESYWGKFSDGEEKSSNRVWHVPYNGRGTRALHLDCYKLFVSKSCTTPVSSAGLSSGNKGKRNISVIDLKGIMLTEILLNPVTNSCTVIYVNINSLFVSLSKTFGLMFSRMLLKLGFLLFSSHYFYMFYTFSRIIELRQSSTNELDRE